MVRGRRSRAIVCQQYEIAAHPISPEGIAQYGNRWRLRALFLGCEITASMGWVPSTRKKDGVALAASSCSGLSTPVQFSVIGSNATDILENPILLADHVIIWRYAISCRAGPALSLIQSILSDAGYGNGRMRMEFATLNTGSVRSDANRECQRGCQSQERIAAQVANRVTYIVP